MQGLISRFVRGWGLLVADIDDASQDAIRLEGSHKDWRHRRPWSMYEEGNPKPSLRNCLTLVLDRSSDMCKRTPELCEVRKQIAHGDLRHAGIYLPTVIEDFHRIQSSLVRE